MDKLDHASIVDGCLLSGAKWKTYRHNDMDAPREAARRRAQGEYGTILVVADSVFSMDGDVMDLPTTKALCERYGARLMVDEAHSIGSLGATGHGIEEHFDMFGSHRPEDGHAVEVDPERRRLPAPAATSSSTTCATISRPFIFSAALPPAQTAAALEAFDVIEDEPWRVAQLHRVTGALHRRAQGAGLGHDGLARRASCRCSSATRRKTMDLTRMLFDRGVFVCPIVHPAVPRGHRPPAHLPHGDAHRRGHDPGAWMPSASPGAHSGLSRASPGSVRCLVAQLPCCHPGTLVASSPSS